MKNRHLKRTRQEIPRPAYKKPRPKKYVEPKIPDLPPVSSNQIIIKESKEILAPTSDMISKRKNWFTYITNILKNLIDNKG